MTISAALRTNIAILNLALVPLGLPPESVKVSATIGQNSYFTIFGYTSPSAYVEMYGSRVYQKAVADSSGYFEFKEVVLPQTIKDLCLSAQDTNSRPTPPSCFSLPPITNQHRNIGPVLIAPSLTIAKNTIKPGEANYISGETIPKTNVKIKIFPQYSSSPSFPKPAFAANATPVFILETIADSKGQYSLFLPSSHANSYLINTQTEYKENPTPPSFQVSYSLPNYSLTLLQLYPLLLPLLFLQVLFISILLFARRRQMQSRALAIYQKSLSIPKRSLVKYPTTPWPRS